MANKTTKQENKIVTWLNNKNNPINLVELKAIITLSALYLE